MKPVGEQIRILLCKKQCSSMQRTRKCSTPDGACLLHKPMLALANEIIEDMKSWHNAQLAKEKGE